MSKIIIKNDKDNVKVSKYIYGQFSEHLGRCIYEGLWVGQDSDIPNTNGIRNDVVSALRDIKVPVLRWPGGCFADEYHWRDGIGPFQDRKKIVNTNWGGVVENNHFGTHEFFELCRQLDTEAYVNGNVGSGTVQEMSEWMEYMMFDGVSPMADLRKRNGHEEPWKVKFFGVGNENWGCGGNMRPEYYADLYRRYQTFVRNYNGSEPVYKIACGPNDEDYNWMEVLLKNAAPYMDGISLHHYSIPTGKWDKKGAAVDFPEDEWFSLIKQAQKTDEIISKHSAIMDKYDPKKNIGLIVDEWGSWLDVEPGSNPGFLYQQNTIRDAMVAAISLHIFQKHADRVHMANIAQMVNVLQAMILTEGSSMVKTPTYYVFKMLKDHQDAELVQADYHLSNTTSVSTTKKDGEYLVSICNFDVDASDNLAIDFGKNIKNINGEILAGAAMDSHNSFENPEELVPRRFTSFSFENYSLTATLPPMSVVTLHVQPEK